MILQCSVHFRNKFLRGSTTQQKKKKPKTLKEHVQAIHTQKEIHMAFKHKIWFSGSLITECKLKYDSIFIYQSRKDSNCIIEDSGKWAFSHIIGTAFAISI